MYEIKGLGTPNVQINKTHLYNTLLGFYFLYIGSCLTTTVGCF